MSTGIGALRAPRQTAWPAVVLALLVVMTVAIIATTLSFGGSRPTTAFVGRHLVNTPAEVSGGVSEGIASGTAANTPTELSAGMNAWFNAGCGSFGCRNETGAKAQTEFSGGNTPSEISGGLPEGRAAEIYDRHQRG